MNVNQKDDLPLVSVPVVTYNSSKTVLETLDSIYNQTYPNIELVVSDDCSTDNTVEICREWIETHKDRFVRTELLTVDKNTGVSANGNRARTACKGEWVKGIAGDDIMLPNCINEFVRYVEQHHNAIFVFCRVDAFGSDQLKVDKMNRFFKYEFFTDWDNAQQLGYLLAVDNCIPAMGLFCNNAKSKQYGIVNDERVPNLEDHTKWINLLRAGAKFYFLDKVLVRYRLSNNSLCTGTLYSDRFKQSLGARFVYYLYPTYRSIVGRKKAWYKYASSRCAMGHNVLFWKLCGKLCKLLFKL